jgi:hypothetical protein
MLENLCTVGSPWILLNFANPIQPRIVPLVTSFHACYNWIGHLIIIPVLDKSGLQMAYQEVSRNGKHSFYQPM